MVELAYRPDGLLGRWRRPARLSFEINGVRLSFANPVDLDFALAPRSTLPLAKLLQLVEQPDEQLEKEAVAMKILSSRLWEVYVGTCAFEGCRAFFQQFGIQSVSKDQDWRAIIVALLHADDQAETFLRVAVARFIDYLDSRHAAIRLILRHRHGEPEPVAPARHQRTFGSAPGRRRVVVNFST